MLCFQLGSPHSPTRLHLCRCAHGGYICRHVQTGSAAGSPPTPALLLTFLFLEVCCPRNPFPFEDFLDAAANFHSCRGVPPQTLPGMSLFHLFWVPESQRKEETPWYFHAHDSLPSTYTLEAKAAAELGLSPSGPEPLPGRQGSRVEVGVPVPDTPPLPT